MSPEVSPEMSQKNHTASEEFFSYPGVSKLPDRDGIISLKKALHEPLRPCRPYRHHHLCLRWAARGDREEARPFGAHHPLHAHGARGRDHPGPAGGPDSLCADQLPSGRNGFGHGGAGADPQAVRF